MSIKDFESQLIGQIVAEDIKTRIIFEKNGLVLNGSLAFTVFELQRNVAIDYPSLINDLTDYYEKKEDYIVDFKLASTDTLIDYIERFHHETIKKTLPEIIYKGREINEKYGDKAHSVKELHALSMAFAEDIFNHMDMEEKKLFPVIRTMIHYNQDFSVLKDLFVEMDLMEPGPNGELTEFPRGSKELLRTAYDRQNIVYHLDDGSMGGGERIPFDDSATDEEIKDIYHEIFNGAERIIVTIDKIGLFLSQKIKAK